METEVTWMPFKCLEDLEEKNIVLMKLNTPFDGEKDKEVFSILWKKACLKAVVDGAINEIYNCPELARDQFTPDVISGDFDSAQPHVMEYYKKRDVEIILTPNQDETDFTKALRIVCDKLRMDNGKVLCICVHVSFDGRFDHIMGNINTLFFAQEVTSLPIYLISNKCVAFIIQKGRCLVNTASPWRGVWCGLVPIAGPCQSVTTEGLLYNMDHKCLAFGSLVSTSNSFNSDAITIETDNYLLIIIGMAETE